jgi:glycosyltransferase involved in cell wall biosynthesis
VLPILNEERYLKHAIEAILAQKYPGEIEVILAIGPSKDATHQIAETLRNHDSRVVLVDNPTGRTANGLNLAIKKSRFEIICRIDGHAEISDTYIKDAVAILEKTGAVNVGGIMAAVGKNKFEAAVATAMRSPLGVGGARFHTGGDAGPADTVYLGVFKKSALLSVGLYDERFTRAQDWELNYRLRQEGGVIWFDPRLAVTYRPRPTLKALAKQYFEYGRWRHAVVRTHKGTANYRYLAPPLATLIIALSLILGFVINAVLLIPALTYASAIFLGSMYVGKNLLEKIALPSVLVTMHISWGLGYLTSPRKLIS